MDGDRVDMGLATSDEERWRAVLGRDARADGRFCFGVTSTGVYCRPSCPSRRPKRENVVFFDSAEAAEEAGFRPCLRCRPNEVSTRQRIVAQVQSLIDASDNTPSLAELSATVRLSPSYLQRVFKQATGLTPKEYAAARRAGRLKSQLKEGATVTEAMYGAGYGSSRALYEAAPEQLGMKPGAYREGGKGERVLYALTDTPFGRMLLAATKKGVCMISFGDDDALAASLRDEFPRAEISLDPASVESHVEAVKSHLAGQNTALDLPLDLNATAFQRRVWAALREIPYGETRTYSEVARMIGAPTAVRAVARACATNPVSVVIPCHRVIRTGGGMGGYRWGLPVKEALLEKEASGIRPAERKRRQD